MTIQSKPTRYNGYRFRSRTEARWAVYFDSMGIKYHYEHEDFYIFDDRRYLPDFWLPNFMGDGCFAEVKGVFTVPDENVCVELCEITKKPVIMLEDVPDFKVFKFAQCVSWDKDVWITEGLFYPEENRIYTEPCIEDRNGYFNPSDWTFAHREAVYASRAARFEYLNQ